MRQSYMTTSGSTRWSASSNPHNTIALFGAGSKTATHFLRLALDAGYHVRALLIMPSSSEPSSFRNHPTNETVVAAKALKALFADQAALHWVRADSVYDARACKRVLRGAHYVVCMMNDAPLTCDSDGLSSRDGRRKKSSSHSLKTTSKERTHMSCSDPSKPLTSFLQILYPLMKEEASIQVFLYQVSTVSQHWL